MSWRAHDLVVTVLVILFVIVLSLPAGLGRTYWADSPFAWAAHMIAGALLAGYVLFAFLQNARRLAREEDSPEQDRPRRDKSRTIAIGVFGGMLLVWILLSAASFVTRPRPDPERIVFQGQNAVAGKRVFQAYNCMGCHTIVGNGAYFGPDLTRIARDAGPAWVATFLSSAGTWPTQPVVEMAIERLRQSGDLDVASVPAYYQRYPAARTRVAERGGHATLMPNLPFTADEISATVAFLSYASRIDTAGWPPVVRADPDVVERMRAGLRGSPVARAPAVAMALAPAAGAAKSDHERAEHGAEHGADLARELGCLACHSTDGTAKVGPTFKGLFGSTVPLADGRTVVADEAYLRESILDPPAKIVKGFPSGVMPPYTGRLSAEQLDATVAFLESLR